MHRQTFEPRDYPARTVTTVPPAMPGGPRLPARRAAYRVSAEAAPVGMYE